jgi:uncharacterized Fe-S cluster-containing protein
VTLEDLPGLNCGLCGSASCADLVTRVAADPDLARRCIYLDPGSLAGLQAPVAQTAPSLAPPTTPAAAPATVSLPQYPHDACAGCAATVSPLAPPVEPVAASPTSAGAWTDTLGREYDFVLEHFPEDPGPREIILPHNPLLTRELDIQVGDVMIGRPLGMSCGCPITHCGVVMQVDHRTGVIVWCVTGPLRPRQEGFKDLGYYVAEGYEGLINRTRREIEIGLRYFFQPERCMLQWRHSGLVNYVSRTATGLQVRVEGLWIG